MKKVRLLSMLLVAAMLFSLAACGGDTAVTDSTPSTDETASQGGEVSFSGEKTAFVSNGQTEYVVVRNKNGTDYETDVAVDIKDRIAKISGADAKLMSDTKEKNTYEILIGSARGANEGLAENEWKVSHDGNSLVIAGGSDKALEKAYAFFMEQFFNCTWLDVDLEKKDTIEIPEDFEHTAVYQTKEEFLSETRLIEYPEYPEEAIPRDYDYYVKVTQGNKTIEIPVYNRTIGSNYFISNMVDGDVHRRYAEFGFSGDPVTIEVTANISFDKVSVMPSSKGIDFTVNKNVITYTIDEPQTTMVKLNDDRDTILAIFAEAPEYEDDIPNRALASTYYFDPGYHEIEGGEIILQSNESLYIAPGAVVKARVKVSGKDVTIAGRGTLLESSPNRTKADKVNYMIQIENSSNVNLSGIKIVDAHTFNITMTSCKDITIHDVKVLSNQISTDGLSWWAKNTNIHVYDCFWHVSDDIFVVGGNCENNLVENCIVGSDYGVFTPTVTGEGILFKNIDVFRCGRLVKIINNGGDALTTMENIYAEDIDSCGPIFDFAPGKDVTRKYVLKNVSINGPKATTQIISTNGNSGLEVTFDNVWVNGKKIEKTTSFSEASKNSYKVTVTDANDKNAAKVGVDNVKSAKYSAETLYIENLKVDSALETFTENSTQYVSAKEVLTALDFTNFKIDGSKFTFEYKDEKYELNVGSKDVTANGKKLTLAAPVVLKRDSVCIPLDFFKTVLGISATYSVSEKRVTVENIKRTGNLLRNGDMEEGMTTDWITRWFTPMYLSTDAHSGKYAMRTYVDPESYEPSSANGIYQDIANVIRRYGNGKYKITCWVKKTAENSDSSIIEMGITPYYSPDGKSVKIKPTTEWQKMEYTYDCNLKIEDMLTLYFYVGYADGNHKQFIIDDMTMEFLG